MTCWVCGDSSHTHQSNVLWGLSIDRMILKWNEKWFGHEKSSECFIEILHYSVTSRQNESPKLSCFCVWTHRCRLPQRAQFHEPPTSLWKSRHFPCSVQHADSLPGRRRQTVGWRARLRPRGGKRHLQRLLLRGAGLRVRQDGEVWPHPYNPHRTQQKQPAWSRERDDGWGRVNEDVKELWEMWGK